MSNEVAARQIENLLGIIETVQREKDDLRAEITRYLIELRKQVEARTELERKLAEAREVFKTVEEREFWCDRCGRTMVRRTRCLE